MILGTDIAGSIRVPSLFNGIFGIKLGPNLVDLKGFVPDNVHGYQAEMIGIGPMTRHAVDLPTLVKLFVGPENSKMLRLDEHVDLSKVRFYSMSSTKNQITSPELDSDVLTAFNNASLLNECFKQELEKRD